MAFVRPSFLGNTVHCRLGGFFRLRLGCSPRDIFYSQLICHFVQSIDNFSARCVNELRRCDHRLLERHQSEGMTRRKFLVGFGLRGGFAHCDTTCLYGPIGRRVRAGKELDPLESRFLLLRRSDDRNRQRLGAQKSLTPCFSKAFCTFFISTIDVVALSLSDIAAATPAP